MDILWRTLEEGKKLWVGEIEVETSSCLRGHQSPSQRRFIHSSGVFLVHQGSRGRIFAGLRTDPGKQ